MGTAYRTYARPHCEHREFDAGAAVYAVYPPAIDTLGITSYLIVAASTSAGDTVIYPCDSTGLLLSWRLIGSVLGADHGRALKAAGYELEVVHARA